MTNVAGTKLMDQQFRDPKAPLNDFTDHRQDLQEPASASTGNKSEATSLLLVEPDVRQLTWEVRLRRTARQDSQTSSRLTVQTSPQISLPTGDVTETRGSSARSQMLLSYTSAGQHRAAIMEKNGNPFCWWCSISPDTPTKCFGGCLSFAVWTI
jgi:hypothetical protein